MSVVPMYPQARFYCSDCDEHFYEYERERHQDCCKSEHCAGCGRALQPGDDDCPMCGGKR